MLKKTSTQARPYRVLIGIKLATPIGLAEQWQVRNTFDPILLHKALSALITREDERIVVIEIT